jgi:hypothetical protein
LPTLYYGPHPSGQPELLGFAVLSVLPAARAVLLQREPIGIVPLVFFAVIVALLTLGARQGNEHAISLFGHFSRDLPLQIQKKTRRGSPR